MIAKYAGRFADIIASDYNNITKKFEHGLKSKGYTFDEDIFMDTFISCNNTLGDKILSSEEAIKYFWSSYINKLKTISSQKEYLVYIDDMNDGECEDPWEGLDIADTHYDSYVDDLYNYIMNAVKDKYGEEEAKIFDLHINNGVHTKTLVDMGYKDVNFEYLVKKIKRYIKTHVINLKEIKDEHIKDILIAHYI